jgi:hypothetical protein
VPVAVLKVRPLGIVPEAMLQENVPVIVVDAVNVCE